MADSVTPIRTQARNPRTPESGPTKVNPVLIAGTLIFLSVGAATLIFWYIASTTGFVNLSEGGLYLIRSAGLAGIIVGAIGLFIVVNTFRRAALPIADLMAATERVTAGDYDIEVTEQGPREIRALTRAFNEMTDRLKTRDAKERKLTTEIAHELLESATALKQAVDSLKASDAGTSSGVREGIERLQRFAEDIDTVTHARNGPLSLSPEPTDLCVLVPDTISGFHREASARGVALRAELPETPLFFVLDPRAFRQILKHMLIHALGRSSENSDIHVELSQIRKPSQVQLKVTDQGATIPPEELPFLLDHMSPGNQVASGLELVVANQLVQAQGGEVLVSSTADRGTTVTVLLPPETPHA